MTLAEIGALVVAEAIGTGLVSEVRVDPGQPDAPIAVRLERVVDGVALHASTMLVPSQIDLAETTTFFGDLETQINQDQARRIARRLAAEVPGLHHARVTCERGGCSVVLRTRDAGRLEEVRAAMRRIHGPFALGYMVSVVPDRVRCTQHSDCRKHLELGRACWEASRDR